MTTNTINKPARKIRKVKKVTPGKILDLIGNHKLNPNQAAKILNVDPNSIYQAIQRYRIDISAFELESIKTQHESELIAINALARGRIFDKLLNDNNLGLIEITACLDRTFQQLRELQGKGHSSINIFTLIVQKADEQVLNITSTSTISSTPVVDNQPIVSDTDNSTRDCR